MTLSNDFLRLRYAPASKDIVAESFEGDVVVLDLCTGTYFGFSDSGSVLWEALAGGVKPEEILEISPPTISSTEVETFVEGLIGHRLLSPSDDTAAVKGRAEYAERLRSAKEPPEILSYDDLADMFLADPIHDVEESVGWPTVRQT